MRHPRRVPLVAAALLAMVWGVWLGLERLGWPLPLPWPEQLILHGPLMIGGFLGTLIGLERAVGIGRRWGYAAPVLCAAGTAWMVLGPAGRFGPLMITAGSIVVLAIFAKVLAGQLTLFSMTMTAGAVSWIVGNLQWLSGAAIYRVVFWWVGFLVLTIAGERLELNRLRRPSPFVRVLFLLATAVLIAGLAAVHVDYGTGVRIAGLGLLGIAAWLGAFDIARRTIRQNGLPRFIAVCLLSGYVWLAAGGAIALITGVATTGTVYDAALHAIFVGFVLALIFGHAPIVFPAILGRPMPFSRRFYAHLLLLHASLVVRLIGDFSEELGRWRAWGGAMNAATLALFVLNTVWSLIRSARSAA